MECMSRTILDSSERCGPAVSKRMFGSAIVYERIGIATSSRHARSRSEYQRRVRRARRLGHRETRAFRAKLSTLNQEACHRAEAGRGQEPKQRRYDSQDQDPERGRMETTLLKSTCQSKYRM